MIEELVLMINEYWEVTLTISIILLGAALLTKTIRWLIDRSFVIASKKLKVDPTRYRFLKNAASFIVWMLAIGVAVLFIPSLKAFAITLFAGAGIFVAILGFAAQQAFSNIIGGIFIVIFRPFRVGDMIKVGGLEYGIVEDINLRHTIINNFENKRIIIPNSVISSETIVNDSIGEMTTCRWIELGISYDSDLALAIKIIQEEAIKHPSCIDVRKPKDVKSGVPQVIVYTMNFGESSIDLRADVWINNPYDARKMHSDILTAVKKRFDTEGIEIPFPYRTIVYKNDLPKPTVTHQ